MNKAKIVFSQIVISGEDTAIVLQLVDKRCDQMSFLIEMLVIAAGLSAIFPRRNDRNGAHGLNQSQKLEAVVGLVADHMLCLVRAKQSLRLQTIVDLTSRKDEVQGITQSIHQQMNLGVESAATAA